MITVARKLIIALTIFTGCSSDPNLYKDPSQPVDSRVENILSQMTLDEKIDQLNMLVLGKNDNMNNNEDREGRRLTPETGAFIFFDTNIESSNEIQRRAMEDTRLGIPALLGHDVIHGYRTLFPMPLAQACSWSLDNAYEASRIAAKESYLSGIRWTFSPMLDVARDGRWGRVAESYGEDPYTNAEFAKAVVKGYQGENLSDKYSIAACLKHFAGYAYSQSGRDYNPTNISDLSLWETVLPPFKAAVEVGAATVMSSFNDLNGVPTVANKFLLTDVLRNKLGFEGFVVSDWRSVEQLMTQKYAADALDASVKALNAGNDMDMYDNLYRESLAKAVEMGAVDVKTIDEAVRRILKVKFELGLFENPYVEQVADAERYMEPSSVELSKKMAEESMVLLKNDNQTLPLSDNIKSILLVGPMVDDRTNMMGTWRSHGLESDVVTIHDGLIAEFGDDLNIRYIDGASFIKNQDGLLSKMATASRGVDMIVLAMGEEASWSGENGSKASLALPDSQEEVVIFAKSLNCPVVLLTSSGRPLALSNVEPYADAILQIWQPGLYGGEAVAGILSGRVNPSGRLAITFPYTTGQVPIFYNYRVNARNLGGGNQGIYRDAPTEPLYPFGYGLSYSDFEYSNITTDKTTLSKDEVLTVTVDVTNSSDRNGYETIFWYVDDVVASTTQPVKTLRHFEKREVKSGESEKFTFEINPMKDLSFVDRDGERILEAGEFNILVGDESIRITLE